MRSHRNTKPTVMIVLIVSAGLSACGVTTAVDIQPESAPTLIAATHPRKWSYVAIGGDFTYGQGWDDLFASHLQDDLSIQIDFQDLSTHDNIRLTRWLERIESDDDLRRAIENADVLTVDVQLEAYFDLAHTLFESDFCGGPDGQDCLRKTLAELQADVGPFFDEIVRLAPPTQTLVYSFDLGITLWYAPLYSGLAGEIDPEKKQVFDVAAAYVLEGSAAVAHAAESRGITVVNLPTIFFPDGAFADPSSRDYFLMLGFSSEGDAVIADLLQQTGYRYHQP